MAVPGRLLRFLPALLAVGIAARGWASSLDPNSAARYVGSYGLEVVVDDSSPAWVQDSSPSAEASYRVRFYTRLDRLAMAGADEFDLFVAYGADSTSSLRLSVFHDGVSHRLRLRVREDDGIETLATPGVSLVDGWWAIELDWQSATAVGTNDGVVSLWVNGATQTGLDGLDTDTRHIDTVRWGAVDGLDLGTSGSLLLDEFDSRTTGPIGLHPVFSDVELGSPYRRWILSIYNTGVTSGCGPGLYCPSSTTTRGQMAVFLLKSKEGSDYLPGDCVSPSFSDVPCSHPFADWIEELYARGITAGCGVDLYCPDAGTTRGQMAVFLLRTLEGSGYNPPACTVPTFGDVPCSHPFAAWIEELYDRGITAGCGSGLYCPAEPVKREQMAVFLARTFSLPVPTL